MARDFTEAKPEEYALIPSPATGEPGSLTPPRAFNMMFETYVGAMRDASSIAYLRPETAQGMFVDFKNVIDTSRVKLPFGIAQIGKSFRNEITPRNFIFRSREFEQMEMEYFIHPDADWLACHEEWLNGARTGSSRSASRNRHLSPLRTSEGEARVLLAGAPSTSCSTIRSACRSCGASPPAPTTTSSSTRSSRACRRCSSTRRPRRESCPHVIEPAVGVDRIMLAVLCAAYAEDEAPDEKGKLEKRTVLRLHPRLAPFKVAVLPLLKNKPSSGRPGAGAPREAEAPLRRGL